MACAPFCNIESVFIFINIAFAMYSGALLSTAARLAWDPSTYSWFRFLAVTQYRACAAFALASGAALALLVYLAAAAAAGRARRHPAARNCLRLYAVGVVALCVGEVSFGAWLAASLAAWWRVAPQAELARRGLDLVHDLKPALLAVERYRDLALPLYHMIEEVEHEAPNNVYVIIVFMFVGMALQVSAVVVALRLWRGAGSVGDAGGLALVPGEDDAEGKPAPSPAGSPPPPASWRKQNLRMYTIIDKIF